ncbi:class I SAM-dependent methyltransferase [Actinokineospora bangkokensis]|uniref:Methyltransferase type 11 domain-containing protein n=1 Tax=Actinokineospora bangkokensis TaxID=1193682 RepID=A0A1Q9LDF3_9PSEU|nr:class I SAM-dependent methyltransferase [Actinokineospora bangkokensis]OLR90042.1 hypothetical protein BJP25_03425 [Actinokineospora bangkokensis]
MIHEDPRAYLLAVEGAALLRSFTGHHDAAFVAARLAEVRAVLDLPATPVDVARASAAEGYRIWAAAYDGEDNSAFLLDTPVLAEVLDTLTPAAAVDAGAGTGRVTRLLLDRGWAVTAVDPSPEMLAHNPAPTALGEVRALPLPDASTDLVTCALALTHVESLVPAFTEFARVLRPGGSLLVSDVHPEAVARGSVPPVRGEGGRPMRLPAFEHLVGDYVRAGLGVGLQVARLEELRTPVPVADAAQEYGPWDVWPWSLAAMVPEAAAAAFGNRPSMLIGHWVKDPGSTRSATPHHQR